MSSGEQMSWEGRILASQFEIKEQLGRGGMGVVYKANQKGMDRTVVVKVMHAALSANDTAVERFRREAQSVGKLNHPNIVQVHMFGEADEGDLYIAMEYVDGRSLSQDLRVHGAMHEARALRIVDQVLSALIEAHGVGIIHRDLKPDNIMLTSRQGNNDYAKVLDFGLAKVFGDVQADDTITQAGMVTGTPRYMSPEQARGLKLDARTDIYSLGVVLYEMLTGKHPFDAESALDFMHKHTTEEVPSPRDRVEGLQIAPRTEKLLMASLAKKPEARFQSAREMQREVRTILRDFPDGARYSPTPVPPGSGVPPLQQAPTVGVGATTAVRRNERRKLVTAVSILAIATLLLIVAMLVMFSQASRTSADGESEVAKSSPPAKSTAHQSKLPDDGVADVAAGEPDVAPLETPPDVRLEPAPKEASSLPSGEIRLAPDRDPAQYEAELRAEIEAAVEAQLKDMGDKAANGDGGLVVPPPIEYVPPERDVLPEPLAQSEDIVEAIDIAPADPDALRQIAFAGALATEDAELVARTGQVCNYATALAPESVVKHYEDWAKSKGFKFRKSGQTLLFQGSESHLQTVNVTADGSMTTENPHLVSVIFRKDKIPPMSIGKRGPFGEPLPPGAVPSTLTPYTVLYDIAKPVAEVAPFFASRYEGKPGVMVTRNRVMGSDQLVVFAQEERYPFMTITVMKSMTARNMTQITVTSREMMNAYGAGAGN